jgi:hypothetical protein
VEVETSKAEEVKEGNNKNPREGLKMRQTQVGIYKTQTQEEQRGGQALETWRNGTRKGDK